jgi:hypothetical protein
VKGKGFCEGFHPISSLELRRSSLRLFLVFGTHIFYLVIIIVEISWSQEEIWGKGRIRNNSNSYNPLWESHCNQEGISLIVEQVCNQEVIII